MHTILWQDKSWQTTKDIWENRIIGFVVYLLIFTFVGFFLFLHFKHDLQFYSFLIFASILLIIKTSSSIILKKQKPLQISTRGILYTKLTSNNNLLCKNEIKSIVFGKYQDVSSFGKFIGKYSDSILWFFVFLGHLHCATNIGIWKRLSKRNILKIETKNKKYSFFANDIEGFIAGMNKIGIYFENKNKILYYKN